MYQALLSIVVWITLGRCAWLLVGLVRMASVYRRARTTRWGLPELFTVLELPLFFLVTLYLHSRLAGSSDLSTTAWLTAIAGAVLALSGLLISLWSFYTTYRAGVILSIGHYVEEEHKLVTSGAYGFVRHPIYLGVFLIWLSLALAFKSPVVLLLTVLYVIPAYLVYIRSEERMMLEHFGDTYSLYVQHVPMIVPRLRWH